MTDMDIQKQINNHFWYNYDFQKIISVTFKKKVSGGFELWICGSADQCPRPLSYDDVQESRPI